YREVTSSISRITVNYAETVAKQSAENILDLLKRDGQELNAGEIQQLHEFCLLYHCAFDALPVQPAQNSILRIARRIEKATRKLSQDFSLQRASIHFDRLAKCRRDYRISHRSTPVLTRVWLQAMRKFSTN
ncbi:MAG TPA: hypothetical protein VI731_11435, partial [Bacteroidia bacterium]|nr:hypothetical protein [Bacteroidia bacterium]